MKSPFHYARKLAANPGAYLNAQYLKAHFKRESWRSKMAVRYAVPFVQKCARIRRVRKVAFFPLPMDRFQPAETYVAWKILKTCGAKVCASSERDTDLAFAWHPSTQYEVDQTLVQRFRERHAVINAECTDIRKSRVGQHFRAVFGYGLEIDPLTYDGVVLRKSERNGGHDAQLFQGPLASVEPGYVYQRCVDFQTPKGMVEWRVLIVAGKVTGAYENYRPLNTRFQALAYYSRNCDVSEVFSRDEREKIEQFCASMKLDLGALDVLRDQSDGRIYICDCNNTPTGPSEKLTLREQFKLIRDMADAFEAAYLT